MASSSPNHSVLPPCSIRTSAGWGSLSAGVTETLIPGEPESSVTLTVSLVAVVFG